MEEGGIAFPWCCILQCLVYFREASQAAVVEATAENAILLQDHELVQLYDETNFKHPFESQRFNTLVLGFRTGSLLFLNK